MGAFDIGATAAGATNGAVGQALGMVFGGMQDRRQLKQQSKLNDLQVQSQIKLGQAQEQQQLDMWNKTNVEAQVKHIKDAGMNPALMYGAGSGGGTTGAGMATGVSSSNAADSSSRTGMGMQMAAQLQLMQAQKENIEADTANKKADATYTGGAKTENTVANTEVQQANIININQDTLNKTAQKYLIEANTAAENIRNSINAKTAEDQISTIESNAKIAIQNIRKIGVEADIAEATENDQIKKIHAEAIGAILQNSLTKANIANTNKDTQVKETQIVKNLAETGLTVAQTQNIATTVAQKWVEISLNKRTVDQNGQKVALETLKTELSNGGVKPDSPEWVKAINAFNHYMQSWVRTGAAVN